MSEIAEILDKVGLNWTVRTENIISESGVPIKGYSAIIRDDNNATLSVRSDSYHPYQNHELMELLYKVSNKTGLPIKNGGFFGDGHKVFVQLKSNDLKIGTDRVEGYVTGINSFDGSTSLAFGNTNVTISCQNTFFAAYREVSNKVRHTKYMDVKIDEICQRLENAVIEEKKIFDSITKLTEVRMDDKVRDLVTRALFNIDRKADLKDEEAISTVTRNKMTRFFIDLNGEVKEKGDSLWGLFSGVTKFTTHSLSKGDNTEAKLFGVYGNREREIFTELVEMVGA
jgi:phage/plasmid-like protein (TIGR03299 family)